MEIIPDQKTITTASCKVVTNSFQRPFIFSALHKVTFISSLTAPCEGDPQDHV